jgi:hypothetical protein
MYYIPHSTNPLNTLLIVILPFNTQNVDEYKREQKLNHSKSGDYDNKYCYAP